MRKKLLLSMSVLLILLFVCSCGASNENEKEPSTEPATKPWKESYEKYLNELADKDLEYAEKDIDGDGTPELILKEGVKITVYTYSDEMVKVGEIDFQTGTTRLFDYEDPNYPGIIYYYVSGGWDHYGYVSMENMKLTNEELWKEDYSGISKEFGGKGQGEIVELSEDKELIKESEKAYDFNYDLVFNQLGDSKDQASTQEMKTSLKIPKKLRNVVNNKEKFIWTETEEQIYLKDFDSDNQLSIKEDGSCEYSKDRRIRKNQKIEFFCINDMDNDGIAEVLLNFASSDILVLHLEDESVYGYKFLFRDMKDHKTDGSFDGSDSAATYYVGKIQFNGVECSYTELCCSDELDLDKNKCVYRLNGKSATKAEVVEFLEKQKEKEDAQWYLFNENLELIPKDEA